MNKKEYIEKLENLILQRVKYHAPKPKESEIDYSLLSVLNIDACYPIFIFKKPLNKIFYQAFLNAKKHAKFNLVLTEKPLLNEKKVEKLEKTYLILNDEMGGALSDTLEALNINYLSHCNFKSEFKGEFIKVNDQILSFDYLPYYYTKKIINDGVIFDAKQFLLNGKNTIINLINTKNQSKKVKIEVNIPLPRGYYFFSRGFDYVEIENLTNKQKAYFNFYLKKAEFSFSNMTGLESSTFASVNMICEIELKPHEKKQVYFNFGENKYCFYDPKSTEEFFKISQIKFNEIFDVKVQTRNIKFDNDFNLSLPRKILEKWQKFDIDEESINSWLKIKHEIVKISEKGAQISDKIKDLKEVKFYRNSAWKRVFILHNDANYLFANKIKYFNYNLLTKEIFDKNNEIYLSFAD